MKRSTFLIGILSIIAGAFALAGCSSEELAQFSHDHPSMAPTTRRTETVFEAADGVAAKTQIIIDSARPALAAGQAAGIPYTDVAMAGLTILSGALGLYAKRRHTALKQTVVGLAKVPLTEPQKQALASAQDASTKAMVESIKG
jgi:hypothetical protein